MNTTKDSLSFDKSKLKLVSIMCLALGLVIKALTDYSDYSYHPESQSVGKKPCMTKQHPGAIFVSY